MKKISLFITLIMLITAFAIPMNAVAVENEPVLPEGVQEENLPDNSESPAENKIEQSGSQSMKKRGGDDEYDVPGGGTGYLLNNNNNNNISIYNGLIANFKYEKTIDMTSASNRTNIPDVDFDFTLYAIPQSDYSKYGVGETFGDPERGDLLQKVMPGNLGRNISSKHFSRVSFRSTDTYDPELTKLMDGKDTGEKVLNHILKYDWGEMRSSDHSQTAIARKPSPKEEELRNAADAKDPCHTWPADTIGWRTSQEYNNGVMLWNYDFNTFDYVKTFALHVNRAVTYYAYTYRRPLLTHCVKEKTGKYKSISKGLLTATEYEELCEQLYKLNPDWEDDSGSRLSYRFLLKENQVGNSNFKANSEIKIVDWFPSEGSIAIFDGLEDAKESYNKIVTDTEGGYINRLDERNIFPDSSFTNRYISVNKKTPIKENNKKPGVSGKGPVTGDMTDIGIWVGSVAAMLAAMGLMLMRRRKCR